MRMRDYFQDKLGLLFLALVSLVMILMLCLAFKVPLEAIWAISCLYLFTLGAMFCLSFFKNKRFYTDFIQNMERLDKKYYILETLSMPNFYEGKILYDGLYVINKAMIEHVKNYELQMDDFKEYIEMWIHEVKIPLATLTLMFHNRKEYDKKVLEQLRRIESYLDQVLYYVRQEFAEKDYLIKKNSLEKMVNNVLVKNKDDFLENQIELEVRDLDFDVFTDSKWTLFILNQIINNSVKYMDDMKDKRIWIFGSEDESSIYLHIRDNGIGIPLQDIPKVFEKSFTGENGRKRSRSTGMGLYISKKLCEKLGHKIWLESREQEYTEVIIAFAKNDYYQVLER